MDSELICSMENLQFTAAESESIMVEPPCEAGDSGLWLVGSVISTKSVNGDSVCRIFRSVSKSKNVSEILELRPNFFLIKPIEKAAREMILNRRPWTVHDDLFSIEPYKPEWRTVDFSFTSMVIWVRVYQLPLRAMNGAMGLQLGGIIGTTIGVDHRVEGGNLGEFLRIRVSIDITKPLHRSVMLGNGQGQKSSPCPLKYERLPRFCYFCGLLGHDLASCSTKPTVLDIRKLQYGSWLRVSVQKPMVGPRRKQGIEYFATNGEAAENDGAPADTTPPPAGSGPSAGATNTEDDGGLPKTTVAVVGESSGTGSGLSNAGSDTPAAATKERAADQDAGSDTPATATKERAADQASPVVDVVAASCDPAQVRPLPTDSGQTEIVAAPCGLAQMHSLTNDSVQADPTIPTFSAEGNAAARVSTGPIRSSKRAIQGRYEVCHPIQTKRARLPLPSSGTPPSTLTKLG
ncbi:hypothetical protein GQ457_09G020910 [Hibiscus cannabinus]